MRRRKNGKTAGKKRAVRKGPVVTLPEKRVPDWMVERWMRRVCGFFARLRKRDRIPLDAAVPVSGITREGLRKFERGSKLGPLFATVLRAAYTYRQRDCVLVITPEGPRIQHSRRIR